MIKDLLIILISSSLVNNVVLSQFLGLCPFLGVSKKTNTAAGVGGGGMNFFKNISTNCTRAAITKMNTIV